MANFQAKLKLFCLLEMGIMLREEERTTTNPHFHQIAFPFPSFLPPFLKMRGASFEKGTKNLGHQSRPQCEPQGVGVKFLFFFLKKVKNWHFVLYTFSFICDLLFSKFYNLIFLLVTFVVKLPWAEFSQMMFFVAWEVEKRESPIISQKSQTAYSKQAWRGGERKRKRRSLVTFCVLESLLTPCETIILFSIESQKEMIHWQQKFENNNLYLFWGEIKLQQIHLITKLWQILDLLFFCIWFHRIV